MHRNDRKQRNRKQRLTYQIQTPLHLSQRKHTGVKHQEAKKVKQQIVNDWTKFSPASTHFSSMAIMSSSVKEESTS